MFHRRRYLHRKRNQINYRPYLQIGGMYKFVDLKIYMKVLKLLWKKNIYVDVDHKGDNIYFIVTDINKELECRFSRCRPDGVKSWLRTYFFKYFSGYLTDYCYFEYDSFLFPFAVLEASATTNKTIDWFLNKNSKRKLKKTPYDRQKYKSRSFYTTRRNNAEVYSKLLQSQ